MIRSSVNIQRCRGVTLVEVLVTLIVLAIGLLGLAALQMNSLRNNSSAYERSQATFLAYEIVDRMRTNVTRARAGDYNIAFATAVATPSDCADTDPSDGTGTDCTPGQLAGFDLDRWRQDVAAALPNGQSQVAINGNVVTVSIRWDDERGQAAQELTFTMSTVL